jgi:hypothetical protein
MSRGTFCLLSALSCIVGVVMLGVSFWINPGPPPEATSAQLAAFAAQYFTAILWGSWLQAVGPVLTVVFAVALVCLAGATSRFAGVMTLFGGAILTMVSVLEITFYIGTLFPDPPTMGLTSFALIHASQHLYFIVGAPALFLPLGAVILGSTVLPRVFGYLALLLGVAFALVGVISLYSLTLPVGVTAFAAVQTLWWLAAAIALVVRSEEKVAWRPA